MKKQNVKTKAIFQEGKLMNRVNKLSAAVKSALAVSSILLATGAQASPELLEGGRLEGATVTGIGTSTTTVNQSGQVSYIDWLTYNLGADEVVNYLQPTDQSVSINNISTVGGESIILGQINANGHVYLINPAGVTFGQGAQVNVGGLVVSTLALSQFDENASSATFVDGSSAAGIANSGSLTGATGVTLIGNYINNDGSITTTGAAANLNLIAADQVTLTFDGDGLIQFEVGEDSGLSEEFSDDIDTAVSNAGTLDSANVFVAVDALNDVYASAVNNSGLVTATTFDVNASGNVVLRAESSNNSGLNVSETINITGETLTVDRLVTDEGDGSSITLSSSEGDLNLNSLIAQNVTVSATGDVSQLGTAGVRADTASFTGANVTLTNLGNVSDSITVVGTGAVSVDGGSNISSGVRNVSLTGDSLDIGPMQLTRNNTESSITLVSTGEGNSLLLNDFSADNIVVEANGNVTKRTTDLISAGSFSVTSTGAVILRTGTSSGQRFQFDIEDSIDITGATVDFDRLVTDEGAESSISVTATGGDVEVSSLIANAVSITASGDISQAENVGVRADSASFTGQNVTLDNVRSVSGSLAVVASDQLSLSEESLKFNSSEEINLQNLVLEGDTLQLDFNDFVLRSLESVDSVLSIKSGAEGSDFEFNNLSADTIFIDSAGDVTQLEGSQITTDDLDIKAGGSLTISQDLAIANAISLEGETLSFGTLTTTRAEAEGDAASIISLTSGDSSELTLTGLVADNISITGGVVAQTADTVIQANTLNVSGANSATFTNLSEVTDSLTVSALGDVAIADEVLTLQSNASISGATLAINDIAVSNESGSITLTSTGEQALALNNVSAATLEINGLGVVSQADGTQLSTNALTITATDITLSDLTAFGETPLVSNVTLNATDGAVDIQNGLSVSDDINIEGSTVNTDALTASTGNISITTNANAGDSLNTGALSATSGSISITTNSSADLNLTQSIGAIATDTLVLRTQGNLVQGTRALDLNNLTVSSEGSVTLDADGNQVDSIVLTSGAEALIENDSDISLNGVSADGTLAVSTNGSILQTQDSSLSAGTLLLTATGEGSDIVLTSAVNSDGNIQLTAANVTASGLTSGTEISVTATEAKENGEDFSLSGDLGSVSADSLVLNIQGNIVQGTGALELTSADITSTGTVALNDANNQIQNLALTAVSGDVTSTSAVNLGDVEVSSLILTAGGNITQSDSTSVSATSLHLTANNGGVVALGNAENAVSELELVASGATVNSANDLTLTTIDVSGAGSLTLTSGGDITQSDNSSISAGTTALTASENIVLGQSASISARDLTLTASGGSITQEQDADISGTSVELDANVSISQAEGASLTANSANVSAGGNIILSSVTVSENSVFSGGGDITLGDITAGVAQVTFNAEGAISQADNASIVADTVTLSSNGDIIQATGATINASTLVLTAADGGVVNLSNENNVENLTLEASGAEVNSTSSLVLNTVDVGEEGELSLTSGGAITQSEGASLTARSATLIANGDITQAQGATLNAETLALTALDEGIVALGNINSITNLSLTASSANVNSSAGLNLSTISVGDSGGLVLTSDGAINQSDNSAITGGVVELIADGAITQGAGASVNATTLRFDGGGAVTQSTGASVNADSVVFAAVGGISQAADASVNADSVVMTTSGNITQTLTSSIDADSLALTANDGSISLIGENAIGSITINANGAVINNNDELELNGVNVGAGELALTADGTISHSEGSDITAGSVELVANDGGDVVLTSALSVAGDITLSGANVTAAGLTASSADSTVSVTTSQSIGEDAIFNITEDLGGVQTANLTLAIADSVTQGSDALNVNSLNISSTGAVTLDNAGNSFNQLALDSTAATINTTSSLTLNGVDVTNQGDLTIASGGSITQVQGSTLNAGSLQLDATGNVGLASLSVAQDSALSSGGDLSFSSISAGGTELTLTSGGDISQSQGGSLNATSADLTAQGDIELYSASLQQGSVINSVGSLAIGQISYSGPGDLVLRGSEISGLGSVNGSVNASSANVSLLSDSTIKLTNVSANSLLLAAASSTVDVDTASPGTIQSIVVDNTTASNVTVAVADSVTVNLNAAGESATEINSGFLITTQPVSVEFNVSGLETVAVETLTVSGQESFGSQIAQAETATSNVGGDSVSEGQTIFRTPDPFTKLPADQEPEDEFDEFSNILKPKMKDPEKDVAVAMPVSK